MLSAVLVAEQVEHRPPAKGLLDACHRHLVFGLKLAVLGRLIYVPPYAVGVHFQFETAEPQRAWQNRFKVISCANRRVIR